MPTKKELKELQSRTLDQKIMLTQTRIIEWYEHWKGQVYVSWSKGKDSTVLLHLTRQIYPDVEAVFIDTGLEYPEVRQFGNGIENVTVIRPEMGFRQVIQEYGYPVISKAVSDMISGARKGQLYRIQRLNGEVKCSDGSPSKFNGEKWKFLAESDLLISDKCCDIMKKKPAHIFEKKSGKKPIVGTMTEESITREAVWTHTGCNAFDGKRPQSKPMSFWTEQDVLHYIKRENLPIASVYGEIVPKSEFTGQLSLDDIPTDLMTTGCSRTGCMFCMFGVHLENEPNRFQRMKITHPKQYDYCMRESGLGLAKVLDYIGVKY